MTDLIRHYFNRSPLGTLHAYVSPETSGTHSTSAQYEVFDCKLCGALIAYDNRKVHISWHNIINKR